MEILWVWWIDLFKISTELSQILILTISVTKFYSIKEKWCQSQIGLDKFVKPQAFKTVTFTFHEIADVEVFFYRITCLHKSHALTHTPTKKFKLNVKFYKKKNIPRVAWFTLIQDKQQPHLKTLWGTLLFCQTNTFRNQLQKLTNTVDIDKKTQKKLQITGVFIPIRRTLLQHWTTMISTKSAY